MSVAAIVPSASPAVAHRMPGGGAVTEQWLGAHDVMLEVSGELDLYDEPALVDLLTACIFGGASRITIDLRPGTFIGLAPLRAASRVRRFLDRRDGEVEVRGLRPPLDRVWEAMAPPARLPDRCTGRTGSPVVA